MGEHRWRLTKGGKRRRPGQGCQVMGQEGDQGHRAPGGQGSRGLQGKRALEGEIIRTGKISEGYNGSSDRQKEVKVPDKKAKLAPTFENGSKKESVVETVNVLATKVKLERKIEENTSLQTQLKQKNNKISFLEIKILELEKQKNLKETSNSECDLSQICKELVSVNEKSREEDARIEKLDGKLKRRKEKHAMIRKDLESFKSSHLYVSLSSSDCSKEDKLSVFKKLGNIKLKMLDLKDDFNDLVNETDELF